MWPYTLADLADCLIPEGTPMMGEVGFQGDIDELREYPCNCCYCQGLGQAGPELEE